MNSIKTPSRGFGGIHGVAKTITPAVGEISDIAHIACDAACQYLQYCKKCQYAGFGSLKAQFHKLRFSAYIYIYILEITVFNLIRLAPNRSNCITYRTTTPRGLLVIIL